MSDLLIRDIPDEVLAAIDSRASRSGLSRTEYLRRRLAQDAAIAEGPVEVEDLVRFAESFADLADPAVMNQAWR
jgi:plasmid stability protein